MKKSVLRVIRKIVMFASLSFVPFFFMTCEVGLGESVDTGAPTLSITFPPEGAVVRDWFTLAGTCSDDKAVARVSVSLTNTNTNATYGPYEATVSGNQAWYVNLNKKEDGATSYPLIDGSYTVNIMVYDNSGHSSGPFSRSIDVDNTEPIFIISAPSSTSETYAYGVNLRVQGTVAESHGISSMILDVTDKGKFEQKDVDVSDGCAVDFARYTVGGSDELYNNYITLYGEPELSADGKSVAPSNQAKAFSGKITISDNAYKYQKNESSGENEEDQTGNTTTLVYSNTAVYQTIFGTSSGNLGLTAPQLIQYLNGRIATSNQKTINGKTVKEFLAENAIDTSTADLKFSLNPAARPSYTVNSFDPIASTTGNPVESDSAAANFTSKGSSASAVTATVEAFDSNTLVVPSAVSMWIYRIDDSTFNSEITTVDDIVSKLESTYYDSYSETAVTNLGWTKIATGSGSEGKQTISISSSALSTAYQAIKKDNYYIVALLGVDAAGSNLYHYKKGDGSSQVFGFVGTQSSAPPTITYTAPASKAYFKTSNDVTISGTVKGENNIKNIVIEVSAVDEDNNNEAVTGTVSGETVSKLTKTVTFASSKTEETFSVNLSTFENYSIFSALADSDKVYSYTIKVTAYDEVESDSELTRDFYVDTKAPEIEISAITPSVEGSDYYSSTDKNVYLNGNITVKASIDDTHLSKVYYRLLVNGVKADLYKSNGTDKYETDSDGWYSPGKAATQKINIDTTKYADAKKFRFEFKAEDEAGNSTTINSNTFCHESYSESNGYYTIKQETDKPKITVTSASIYDTNGTTLLSKASMVSGNLFDLTTKKTLDFTVTDDDGLSTVSASSASDTKPAAVKLVFTKDGETTAYKENWLDVTGTKTSYSGSYNLADNSFAEGVYKVVITATDNTWAGADTSKQANRQTVSDEFYISVDKASPELKETKYGTSSQTINSAFSFEGTASDTNGLYDSDSSTAGAQGAITIKAFKDGASTEYKTLTVDVAADGSWSQDFLVGSGNSGANNYLADGSYEFTITLKDVVGKETVVTRTATIDTTLPAFGTKDAKLSSGATNAKPYIATTESATDGSTKWYNNTSLTVEGTASDKNGIKSIEYATYSGTFDSAASYEWVTLAPTAVAVSSGTDSTVSYSGLVPALVHGVTKIALKVTDNAGNVNYDSTLGAFNIDTGLPSLVEQTDTSSGTKYTASVSNNGTITLITEDSDQVLSDKQNALVITAQIKDDGASGISKAFVLVNTMFTSTNESTAKQAAITQNSQDSSIYDLTYTVEKAQIVNGKVYIRIYDKAGNYTDTTLCTMVTDDTPPVLKTSSISFEDKNSAYSVYYNKTNSKYYLHSGDNHKFTLSGIATDNRELASVTLSVKDSDSSNTERITESYSGSDLSEWSFELDFSEFEGKTATATVLVTDKAGNKHTASSGHENDGIFNIVFDNTAPIAKHDTTTDKKSKDMIFRVGGKATGTSDSEIGGKYKPGTYGNATTIIIRGFYEETEQMDDTGLKVSSTALDASGISQIYYKVLQTKPTADDASTFLTNYASDSDAESFAPLSSSTTVDLSYNVDENGTRGSKPVSYNYISSISKFKDGNNYLLLVAVDNVGNAALDNVVYEYTDASSNTISVEGCFSINVDQVSPELTTNISDTVLTNGKKDIEITGTAKDESAGIDYIAVSITTKVNGVEKTYSSSDSSPKITVTLKTETGDTDNDMSWQAVLDKSIFNDADSGNYTVYATAVDAAGEGNKTTISVANILVDKKAPTLAVSSAYSSRLVATTDTETATNSNDITNINGEAVFAGTAKDNNTLESVKAYYSTTSSSSTLDVDGGKDILIDSASSDELYSWSFTKEVSSLDTATGTIKVLGEEVAASALTGTLSDADKPLYVKFEVMDKAENTNVYVYEYNISPKSDIPELNIANISESGDTLKYVTTLSGTIADDDGISSECVFAVYEVTTTDYSGTAQTEEGLPVNESAWANYKLVDADFSTSTGAWSYSLKDENDAPHELYFYFKDAAGTSFWTKYSVTSESNKNIFFQPITKFKNTEDSNYSSSNPVVFKSDANSPTVTSSLVSSYSSNSESASPTSEKETISSAVVLGGETKKYAKFIITATDTSGISSMTLKLTGKDKSDSTKDLLIELSTETASDSSVTWTSSSSGAATWTTRFIDMSVFASDSVSVKIVPTDGSGLTGDSSPMFYVDNDGPKITVSSPNSNSEQIGNVTISGTADPVGQSPTSTIQFLVPKKGEENPSNLSDDRYAGNLTTTSTVSSWSFFLDGTNSNNASLSSYIDSSLAANAQTYNITLNSGSMADSTDVWNIPVYFRASDELGNVSYVTHSVLYNPNADMPTTSISYPSESDYASGTSYAVIGGTVRATGTVSFADSSIDVAKVVVQIAAGTVTDGVPDFSGIDASGDWALTSDLKDKLTTDLGSAVKIYENLDSLKADTGFTSLIPNKTNWWGIEAKNKSYSWSIALNNGSTYALNELGCIALRACAVSSTGKVGNWSDVTYIFLDASAPTTSAKLKQFKSSTPSPTTVADAEKAYTADMYIKNSGDWYLEVRVFDNDKVQSGTISVDGAASKYVYPATVTNIDTVNESITTSTSDEQYCYLYFPVSSTSGHATYTVYAEDRAEPTHSVTTSYSIYVDNDAPTLTALQDSPGLAAASDIAYTKLKNSESVVEFGATATDTLSGFDKIALYFQREIGSTKTIELPLATIDSTTATVDNTGDTSLSFYDGDNLISAKSMTVVSATVTVAANGSAGTTVYTSGDDDDVSGLYGVWLNGGTRNSTTEFTHARVSDYHDKGVIRVGSLIKIGGSYRMITALNDDTVTFDSEVDASNYKNAFFAMALLVDGNAKKSEVGSVSGTGYTIKDDDGDGIFETITPSGSKVTWKLDIFSHLLDDGPITVKYAAFDVAENVATDEAYVMIANNTPRLSKVYLATDLNGDNKFTDNELGTSTLSDTNDEAKYYSALTNGTKGSVQEIVTLKDASGSDSTGLIMRNNMGVAFEFVGGDTFEGYGSGNGTLYYKLNVGQAELSSPQAGSTTASGGNKLTAISDISSSFDSTADTATSYVASNSLTGLTLKTSDFCNSSTKNAVTTYGTYSEYVSAKEAAAKSKTESTVLNYITLTLWDSTKGTTPGTGDTTDTSGNITEFGSQYTVVNIPLYMDLVDDASPVPVIIDPTAEAESGHVELSDTLPSERFTVDATDKELDRDTKVSGVITFTGTVKDEKRVDSIMLTTSKTFNSTAVSSKTVASYSTSSGEFTVTQPATGLTFAVTSNEFTTAEGHKVGWKLEVDTSTVASVAQNDVVFTITANDGTNTETDTYQVDIVPYITGITAKSGKLYRSTYGEYSIFSGDSITVSGYNFGTSATTMTVKVGDNLTVTPSKYTSNKSFTMTVPAYSGELKVSVSDISSLNDKNNNANENNQEAKTNDTSTAHSYWYDNRYLRVWDIGHYFKDGDADAHKPVMVADYEGNLFGAWTRMGDGQVIVQRTADVSGTKVVQHYDQMAEYAAIGIDTKSSNKGAISILNFNENVGDGGIMTDNGFSAVSNTGGAWGVAIDNALTIEKTAVQTGTLKDATKGGVQIANNPTTALDSNWYTSGYSLASYAMLRDVMKFTSPRTARYGDNMHFVYYDSKDQSLRYTWVKSGASTASYARNKNFTTESWVLIDGTVNGYDRVHDANKDIGTNDAVEACTENSITYSSSSDSDFILTNASLYTAIPAGKSVGIGITYTTTEGTRRILVLDDVSKGTTTNQVKISRALTSEEQSILANTKISKKITIYKGNKNVITESDDNGGTVQAFAAGKFSSVDVIGSGLSGAGQPVIVYYDGTHTRLRIAYAKSSAAPSSASDWVRKDVTYTDGKYATGGSHCAIKIDNSGNLHIIYRSKSNDLMYIKGVGNPTAGYTFDTPLLIDDDTTGTWGTISLRDGTTPIVSYLNSEESEEGVKVAVLRTVDEGTVFTDSDGNSIETPVQQNTVAFDTMIMPLTSGYNVVGENLVCIEANNGNWNNTHTEAGVKVSECEAAVSYQSTRLDLSFLKSEKKN